MTKMDATLKCRMWKVAKVYLALTLFVVFAPIAIAIISRADFFPNTCSHWVSVIYILQPHFYGLEVLNPDAPLWVFWGCVMAIPLWSLCFGWIAAQLLHQLNPLRHWLDWMNPFPILSKKKFYIDAPQKRRIWKVAITHFVMSWLVISLIGKLVTIEQGSFSQMWWIFLSPILDGLQPQIGWADRLWPYMSNGDPGWATPLCFISIPLWSICFGWVFIRIKDWLNHFPSAALKRRIWTVAIKHFVLTALIIILGVLHNCFTTPPANWDAHQLYQYECQYEWQKFLAIPLLLLQPQFWPLCKVERLGFTYLICALVLIPIWSLCFAWIFIRAKDWLNHFPALGRKIF